MATQIVQPLALTPGTREWVEHSVEFARQCTMRADTDCRPLAWKTRELREHRIWERTGHGSWDDFVREALGTDPAFIDKVDEGVRILEARDEEAARRSPAAGGASAA